MTIDTKRLETDAAYWNECGAPEDATHFCEELWYRVDDESAPMVFMRARSKWVHSIAIGIGEWSIDDLIPRPQAPEAEWVDGLPPVSSTENECAIRGLSKTDSFEVIAHRDGKAVVYFRAHPVSVTTVGPEGFRPIRTKEHREREDWINRASKAAGFPKCTATRKVCADIYDGLIKSKGL